MNTSGDDVDRHVRTSYASSSLTPAAIRRQATVTLEQWFTGDLGPLLDEVALVASELATNCVQAGARHIEFALDTDGVDLRVSLVDDVRSEPVPRTAGTGDSSGRGLAIVAALSHEWGVERTSETKTVWADMEVPHTVVERLAS